MADTDVEDEAPETGKVEGADEDQPDGEDEEPISAAAAASSSSVPVKRVVNPAPKNYLTEGVGDIGHPQHLDRVLPRPLG